MSHRGRKSQSELEVTVMEALRCLGDPIALQRNSLAKWSGIVTLAERRYPSGVVARGRVLNETLFKCLAEIESELDGQPKVTRLKEFVSLIRQGLTLSETSRRMGISVEHASRHYKRALVSLLTAKVVNAVRQSGSGAVHGSRKGVPGRVLT